LEVSTHAPHRQGIHDEPQPGGQTAERVPVLGEVLDHLEAVPVGAVCMSVITSAGLLYGVEVSPRRALDSSALAAFMPYVDVIDFTSDAARHHAEIRADLKNRGALVGANDLFIAAHARALQLTLVTNNTVEFARVRGLSIENWTKARRRRR
jgi:tRNA(fMet)-specific endonuclease VapC